MKALIINKTDSDYGKIVDLYPTQMKWVYADNKGKNHDLDCFIDINERTFEKEKAQKLVKKANELIEAVEIYERNKANE